MQKVVRFYPPSYDIRVEEVPIPSIQHPDDAIVKITLAGLCGSDLHVYRGHQHVNKIHTCGHEFVGEVTDLGSSFGDQITGRPVLYSKLKIGHRVVSPFSISCGECHPCRQGFTSRCTESLLIGSPALDGAQAQYIRVPKAGGTLVSLSDPSTWQSSIPEAARAKVLSTLNDSSLLLLADILPTGLFAAVQALNHPKLGPIVKQAPWPMFDGLPTLSDPPAAIEKTITVAIIGLGPVGICAAISLIDYCAACKLSYRILGVDLNEARRDKLERIYAAIGDDWKAQGQLKISSSEGAKENIQAWTAGIGCDAVLEVVGHSNALMLSYELVRPFGVITSVGVHSNNQLPFLGSDCYNKNISLDFGRCPARAFFPAALDLLVKRQDIFGSVGEETSLIDQIVGIDNAKESYRAFDKGEVGKVLFNPWK
ncbi:chaperonin 10-like protein [Crepidotus variabilis]|uniref:Chaperonin 10-like protein n=1 Tax=Crepidotus variabilis TaxID=179855 RepID=A0A9P6ET19_9AGAR|nr:chaperonin 10-like protein [Crepidotus variabilis]